MGQSKVDTKLFKQEELYVWGRHMLRCGDVPEEYIQPTLDSLVSCNLRGVDTHGVHMAHWYAERNKALRPDKNIEIVSKAPAACIIDGKNNVGCYVTTLAVNEAMSRAGRYGIGVALAFNSGHFGAAGYYTMMAAQNGYIGFVSTTALVDLAPWGGLESIVGKNPFSISVPWSEFPIVLDVATSVAARQKVVYYAREGWKLPDGWAMDKNGNPTNDPNEALNGIFLAMGGHKGVGISIMSDLIIAGICGTGYSTEVCPNKIVDRPQNTAHIAIVVNPYIYITREAYDEQIRRFSERYHKIKRRDGVDKLYLPGELEWDTYRERSKAGIPISVSIVKEMNEYADKYGFPRIREL